ncbi:unnamed protein product [Ixodes pacificus]
MQDVKNKFDPEKNREKKLQLLTWAPFSWSREKIMNFFGASERQARQAVKVRSESGILGTVPKRRGRSVSEEVKASIMEFYQDDAVSYCLPGKKDVLRGRQKRLLLLSLKEMHEEWKKSCDFRCGVSTFAGLRPSHFVLAGGSGTHTVCVCMHHQNFKLMLHATGLDESTEELLSTTVCNLHNEECMLDRCAKCPSTDFADTLLRSTPLLDPEETDYVHVQQWVSGVRCQLETIVVTPDEFREKFLDMLKALKAHHFVSKQQARYLRERKANIGKHEALVLVNFAENYSFIVQDAPQSYRWVNTQASVHPAVIYFRKQEATTQEISIKSFSFISDCLEHDAVAVSVFQSEVIKILKQDLPQIRKIHYFSDGASSQYKNKKNFANLCQHENDFGISAEWNFFATSHGKSACDGVGGTVKRLAARASLRSTFENQIMTPQQLFTWAKNNIGGITILWVLKEMVEEKRARLTPRFSSAVPVKGTRSYHHFKPASPSTLRAGPTPYSATQEFVISKPI